LRGNLLAQGSKTTTSSVVIGSGHWHLTNLLTQTALQLYSI
ncbi:hypothetical protein MTR67_030573, partial [Solanum verrucosum]